MLYRLLKFALTYAIKKYFVDIKIVNEGNIPLDKPVILLPNHRSAFMDPIVIATQLKRTTYFLVRGESFTNKYAITVFNWLKMIPIYRKEYDPDKVGQNKDIFKYCHRLMEKQGCLMIFPEGVCQTKYLLAPIKTGAARIALGAEDENDFELDIHLVPIGLNYSNPHRFRGNLTIDVGNPMTLRSYKDEYRKDPIDAVKNLTAEIETQLKDRIITVEDQGEIRIVEQIEGILYSTSQEHSLANVDWLTKRKRLKDFVQKYNKQDPEGFKVFKATLNRFVGSLKRLGISNEVAIIEKTAKDARLAIVKKIFIAIFGLPIFIIGFILHIIPFQLTRILSLTLVKRVDFMGSVALVLGLLLFTIFGGLETYLVYHFAQNVYITILFFILLPSFGVLAYGYLSNVVKLKEVFRWFTVIENRKTIKTQLINDWKEIVQTLRNEEASTTDS